MWKKNNIFVLKKYVLNYALTFIRVNNENIMSKINYNYAKLW